MKARKAAIVVLLAIVGMSVVGVFLHQGGRVALPAEDTIGIVYLDGTLVSGSGYSGLSGSATGSDEIVVFIREARKDPAIRALVLRMNSPGGSAAASQEITLEVKKLRAAGKTVVTSMGDVAASGAYWVAAQTDRILALPATMTGSIGVITEVANLTALYRKVGIDIETIKSGPLKDMGSSSRALTSEERRIMQAMVDDIFDQFVTVVAEGRKLSRDTVLKLADGRVLTGRQALSVGLVDQMGNLPDAIEKAADLAGVTSYRVKEYGKLTPWQQLLRQFGAAARALSAVGRLLETSTGIPAR